MNNPSVGHDAVSFFVNFSMNQEISFFVAKITVAIYISVSHSMPQANDAQVLYSL